MPGAAELTGRGVYYGSAHTEAAYYRGRPVFVIGGANSAAQAALYLARFASRARRAALAGPMTWLAT